PGAGRELGVTAVGDMLRGRIADFRILREVCPVKERFCVTCGGPLSVEGGRCDYCSRLASSPWPSVAPPAAPSPAGLAVVLGGKLLLALAGALFGFALVASGG